MENEKLMTRAEFFAWLKSKVSPKALLSVYGSWVALLDESKEMLDGIHNEEKWAPVCGYDELGNRPRIFFSSGNPVYIYKKEERILAFRAECPEDKNFLQWSDAENSFYCPICETTFTCEGKNKTDGEQLLKWPCRVENKVVHLEVLK